MFEEDLVVADVDLDAVFNARLHDPRLRKGRALDAGEGTARIELPAHGTGPPSAAADPEGAAGGGVATETAARPALEQRRQAPARELIPEIYDALVLGTRDYIVQERLRSGGARPLGRHRQRAVRLRRRATRSTPAA